MVLIEKILVPIDGSEQSNHALEYALDIAEKYSAKIVLLNVIEPVVFTFPIFLTTPTVIPPDQIEYQNAIQKKHKKMLDQSFRMVKKLKPSLMIEKRQCTGRPADEIVRISSEENLDLIIMGSRGLGGIKQFFLGSVSDRVADEAKCPVLLVKKVEDR